MSPCHRSEAQSCSLHTPGYFKWEACGQPSHRHGILQEKVTSMELLPSARVRVAALLLDGRGAKAKAFTFCFARSTYRQRTVRLSALLRHRLWMQ